MSKRWMGTPVEQPQSHGELFERHCPHRDESTGADHHKFDKDGFCIFCGNVRDITANRHRGNPESEAAFQSIKDRLTERQRYVLWNLRRYGDHGATVDDLSRTLHTTPNAISGRITELRIKGKIEKIGTRPTRSGCPAAVWRAL